jgi:hypothetical protein
VALYQKSLGKDKKGQGSGSGYEAHFFIPTDSEFEAGCLTLHGFEQYYGGIRFELSLTIYISILVYVLIQVCYNEQFSCLVIGLFSTLCIIKYVFLCN